VVLFFVDAWFGGVRTLFGGIPTGPFIDLPDPLVPVEDASWTLPKDTELIGYPSAVTLDGRGQFSEHFVLFSMYVKPKGNFNQHRSLLRRHVWWQYTGTPQPYNVRIRLARYWSAAQGDRWDTTAYPIEEFIETGYSFVKDLGELLTREVPGLGLIPLYDCWLSSSADHKTSISPSCDSGYTKRRRLGWIFSSPQWNTRPLYKCWDAFNTDHFVSESASCEGHTYQGVVGHILSPGA